MPNSPISRMLALALFLGAEPILATSILYDKVDPPCENFGEIAASRAWHAHFMKIIVGRGIPTSQAEDLYQDAYVRAMATYDADRGMRPSSWIRQTIHYQILDWRRDRRRSLERGVTEFQTGEDENIAELAVSTEEIPFDDLAMEELADLANHALAHLPQDTQTMIQMQYRDGMQRAEIASHFDVDRSTVTRRIEQALVNLRARMTENGSRDLW